ncbi:LiaF transmembrane domain-containing protein [Roseivirga sp.]|uniref:LiaF transmembrane domain-containing protein n=1 Tax=Roseivirga sp. TaxID=1964215 RepID=UPI002B26A51C|nr:LiaF domain-containing protein [Roseivirga sp.]
MSQSASKRYIVGALFLVIGSLWTLDNIDVLNIRLPWYFTEWYSIMILIGILIATVREKVGLGLTFVAIGIAFLVQDVYRYRFVDIFEFWPVIFIIIGASLLFRRNMDKGGHEEKKNGESELDSVDEIAIFCGAERKVTSKQFRGGKLTTIFGGTDINLLNAELASGTNILDVFVLFGGTEIRVPSDMNVKVQVTAIFGGFSDERKVITENEANNGKELVVKGLVLFGGGEVK